MEIESASHGELAHSPLPGTALVALLGAGLVLVLAAIAVPLLLPPVPRTVLIGAGAVAGLALWAAALPAGLRRATLPWIGGGLAILVVLGAGAGLLASRRYAATGLQDASSFAETEYGTDGTPSLPVGAAQRGPISRLYADAVSAAAREQREFGAALGQLNITPLNSPYLLAQNASVLADCGKIAAAKTVLAENARRQGERTQALLAAIDSSGLDEELRGGMRTMAAPGNAAELRAAGNEMLDATTALCTLLAKRSWYDASGYFGFHNAGDAASFRTITARRTKAAADTDVLQRAVRARMAAGRDIVRDVLSR